MAESSSPQNAIPPGFCVIKNPDGDFSMFPTYFKSAIENTFATTVNRQELEFFDVPAASYSKKEPDFINLSRLPIQVPVMPDISEREFLLLHTSVKTLQEQYGLSYKDAVHRLYFRELQSIGIHIVAHEQLMSLQKKLDTLIEDDLIAKIHEIDTMDSSAAKGKQRIE